MHGHHHYLHHLPHLDLQFLPFLKDFLHVLLQLLFLLNYLSICMYHLTWLQRLILSLNIQFSNDTCLLVKDFFFPFEFSKLTRACPKNVNPFKPLLAVVAEATLLYTTNACSRIFSVFLITISKMGPYVEKSPYKQALISIISKYTKHSAFIYFFITFNVGTTLDVCNVQCLTRINGTHLQNKSQFFTWLKLFFMNAVTSSFIAQVTFSIYGKYDAHKSIEKDKPFRSLSLFHCFFFFLYTMKTHILVSLFLLNVLILAQEQIVFNSLSTEEQIYHLTDTLMETDSIKKSCSSCISLLQIIKRLSFFSEPFLISSLTKICKRTGKVDDEVVSIFLKLSLTRLTLKSVKV